ncbi:MAG: hypothetical protein PF549_01250, partial [Patescibacteria group bacterium]|nr:hypothetical protein [Patescibacteria group bacterium]
MGFGPGGGDSGVYGGGGGYGGKGGNANSGIIGGPENGQENIHQPTSLGSGGGFGINGVSANNAGGGAIKLNISGILNNEGSIISNGGSGETFVWSGGGSGGSVWIEAGTIIGSGTILVNGGNGGGGNGGGGAGGRIAIYGPGSDTLTITSTGGTGYESGEDGSIYTTDFSCDSGNISDTCTITSTKTLTDGETINVNNLIIDSGGELTTDYNATTFHYDSFSLVASGDVTLQNGGTITGNVEITANNLTVDGTSSIDASAKGYAGGTSTHPTGYGPGGGLNGGNLNWQGSGGGYG